MKLEFIKTILLSTFLSGAFFENEFHVFFYIGILYLFVSLVSSRNFNDVFGNINKAWLALFFFVLFVTIVSTPNQMTDLPLKWIHAILCFMCCCKDLRNNPKLLLPVLIGLSVTSLICCIMIEQGIGIGIDAEGRELGEFRLSFFGANKNKVAITFCYAIAATLYLSFLLMKETSIRKTMKIAGLYSCAIIVLADIAAIIYTGSRGGLLAVVLCFLIFAYYCRTYLNSRLVSIILVLMIIVIGYKAYEIVVESSMFMARMEATQAGDLGERDVLLDRALECFEKNPIFGSGLYGIMNYLKSTIGEYKSPHNLYLWILDGGGLIGISMLLYLTISSAKYIWREKHLLALLVFSVYLIDTLKNGAALTNKINYLFFAVALAVSYTNSIQKRIRT